MSEVIRILLVDDHHSFVRSVSTFIRSLKKTSLAGTCESATEALGWLANQNADLVLISLNLPDGSGFDTARKMRSQGYRGRVVLMTPGEVTVYRSKAHEAGIDGVLQKSDFVFRLVPLMNGFFKQGTGDPPQGRIQ